MNLNQRREFTSSVLPDGKTSICSDGRTVWVNKSSCLARFCPISHEYEAVQAEDSPDGAGYREITVLHDTPDLSHWKDFVTGVKKRWGFEIGPEHTPLYL